MVLLRVLDTLDEALQLLVTGELVVHRLHRVDEFRLVGDRHDLNSGASTVLRYACSRSSQSLRMTGSDSFAALRTIPWFSLLSVSQTVFDITRTSGARECSVTL